jgi:hypothetical protein
MQSERPLGQFFSDDTTLIPVAFYEVEAAFSLSVRAAEFLVGFWVAMGTTT